jgi:hypothetical protein
MNQKGFAHVLILIFIGLIGAVSFFGYKNYKLNKNPVVSPGPTITAIAAETLTPAPTVPLRTPSVSSKIYLLKLKLKTEASPPPTMADGPGAEIVFLAEYLRRLMSLPKDSINNLLYDVRKPSPYNGEAGPYNSEFYVVFANPQKLDSFYQDQFITLKVELVDNAMLPYLIKNDYCEQDSDCTLRADMCSQGPYNNYQSYRDPPWGCGPGGYKSTYNWFTWGERDEKLNCEVELKFKGSKCEKNSCTDTGYEKVCISVN